MSQPVRLSQHERQAISTAIHKHFGENALLLLFGSRTQDHKKGGDIDLFVEAKNKTPAQINTAKIDALWDIENAIGEQKIDLVVSTGEGQDLPIYQIAKQTGIPL